MRSFLIFTKDYYMVVVKDVGDDVDVLVLELVLECLFAILGVG